MKHSFRYFDTEYTFDEWVRKEVLKNKGTDNIVLTKDLEKICDERNINYKNRASKAELFDLLMDNGFSGEQFTERFPIGVATR